MSTGRASSVAAYAARSAAPQSPAPLSLLVAACLFAPGLAVAQAGSLSQPNLGSAASMQSLSTSERSGGLRSGEFILTPSLELGGHHDTNVFNGNASEVGNEPESGTSLRLMPRLGLSNGIESDIQFAFDAVGDGRIYLSGSDTVKELTNFGGSADLGVTFFRRRALSFTIGNQFRRALQANNWETLETLNRLTNVTSARVSFHPGEIPERRPLEVSLAGSYVIDRFDEFASGDTSTIRTALTGSWRFLPMTAVLLDSALDFRAFETPSALGTSANSSPWRARVGLAGAFTESLSFRVLGGWGMSLHETEDPDSTFSGFVGSVGVVYRPSSAVLLSLSYDRNFSDSFYGNFFVTDSGTISLRQSFGSLMSATAWFTGAYAQYGKYARPPPSGVTITQAVRKDVQLNGGIRATIEVSRMLSANLGYQLRGVSTDFKLASTDGRVLDAGAYLAHEIFAGVSVRY